MTVLWQIISSGEGEGEGEGVSKSNDKGARPETAPAVNAPHKAGETEAVRLEHEGRSHLQVTRFILFREKKLIKRPKTAPAPAQEKEKKASKEFFI